MDKIANSSQSYLVQEISIGGLGIWRCDQVSKNKHPLFIGYTICEPYFQIKYLKESLRFQNS
jgi:hypothetical protein